MTGKPKLTIAIALLVLAALAATITYTSFLVIGVVADYLGTSRFVAGLLLGALFARFPWKGKGKLRIVGVLPKPVRRPVMVGLLALSLASFLKQEDAGPAFFTGFTLAFVLALPWLKSVLFSRISSTVSNFTAGRNAPAGTDDTVIEGEFRELK